MFKSINISFFVLILMGLASCQNSSQKKIIKMAHGMDVSHPVHKAMEYMAHDLDKISEGSMKLEIYPNQQLGTERQLLELLQIGSLGMTKVSAAVMENFSPDMKIFGLPFLFRSKEHLFKVLDGPIGKNLLNELANVKGGIISPIITLFSQAILSVFIIILLLNSCSGFLL